MNKKPFSFLLAAISLAFGGCNAPQPLQPYPGTPVYPAPQQYRQPSQQNWAFAQSALTSTPEGAQIIINGSLVGTTPAYGLRLNPGDSVTLYLPGFEPAVFTSDGRTVNSSIPLFPTDKNLYSLLEGNNVRFSEYGAGAMIDGLNVPLNPGTNCVLYDAASGTDIYLEAVECSPFYVKFRSENGHEFYYPVSRSQNAAEYIRPYRQMPRQSAVRLPSRQLSETAHQRQSGFVSGLQ